MIALNLLSPPQKEALMSRVRYAVLERTLIVLVAATLASAALLTLVKIQLTKNLAETISRQLLSSQYAAINDQTRQFNDAIVRIEALQKLSYPISTVIEAVTKDAPAGVTVTNLNFNTTSGALEVDGIAVDRTALLAYEQVFHASPFVKSFESPISNLFQKDNVSFQFKADIDGDAVRAALQPPSP